MQYGIIYKALRQQENENRDLSLNRDADRPMLCVMKIASKVKCSLQLRYSDFKKKNWEINRIVLR